MSRWKRIVEESKAPHGFLPRYVSALMAISFAACGTAAWGQAIDPINIGGQNASPPAALEPHGAQPASQPVVQTPPAPLSPVTPAAVTSDPAPNAPITAVPVSPPPAPATPEVPAAPAQAVVPIDVGTPAAPVTPPAPAAIAPVMPGPMQIPPTAATPSLPVFPATPVAPAPVTPSTPPAPLTPAPVAGVSAAADAKTYPVTGIKVDYKALHPQQPPIADIMNMDVRLGILDGAYVAARTDIPSVTLKLSDIGKRDIQKISRSGITAIYGHIVRFINSRGIIGVFVVVDSSDIDSNDADIRPPDRIALQFVVVTSVVKDVRTVGIGESNAGADRVNSPRHAFIRDHSPLKPAAEDSTPDKRMDLLKKDVLDDYVLRLNRQPGRRVDVAVSGTNEPGGVNLDYLVSENRPWYVFAQLSNTGTSQTSSWRERFGFVDNQLTGRDDILSVDYISAGFEASHAVTASYELPFFNMDRVRYKAYASWNEYTASDVGQNLEHFTGDQWLLGNELVVNVFQHRDLFVDAVAGVRFTGIHTDNQTTQTHGQANYTEPYLGLRLDRATDIAATSGDLILTGYATDDDQRSIDGLGRADSTRNPVVLQFDFGYSFFLEPLIDTDRFVAGKSTLSHELSLTTHGQYAFRSRLFPQAEDVAGGLYSVRGYPESVIAGDSVLVASGEYRFHLPRALGVQPDPTRTPFLWDRGFRASPQQVYGRPDWDLIMRAFLDVGQVVNSSRESFEHDVTLIGTGVGVELQLKQNFNLRVDWGVALTDVPDEVKAGSNRFHISSTILY